LDQERVRLVTLETVVQRGLATFVEVGSALAEIRDGRLYREEHSTFEAYCRSRWAMSKTHANRLVEAAEVTRLLAPIGVSPANEAQARELAPLMGRPWEAAEAWRDAKAVAEERETPVTAELLRDAVGRRTDRQNVHFSSETDDWATPQGLYDLLDTEFGFQLDVCASEQNAKCERYFTRDDDGLTRTWEGVCWMNPPYGAEIGQWVAKAHESSKAGATVVCLVPARTDTHWWWNHARYGEVRFLRGRLKFGDSENSAPFPSAVVVFGPPADVKWWEAWPKV
jgi:phage N-6-adenine-methyltransferase